MAQQVVTAKEMSNEQLEDWNKLCEDWLQSSFRPGLRALHYNQDCVQCADIYFVIRFYVDHAGLVNRYEIVREEIDCRAKTPQQNDKLRETITAEFATWVFPPSLRDIIIEARMGVVTRC